MTTKTDPDARQRPIAPDASPPEVYERYFADFEASLDAHAEQWRAKGEDLRSWVKHWILDGWANLDKEALLSAVTDDFVCEDPALLAVPCRGRDAYREFLTDTFTAFPDSSFVMDDPPMLALDGTQLIIPWRGMGHFAGPLRIPGTNRTLAPTGKRFELSGVDFYDFRGEKISRLRSIYDGIGVLRQVGLAPGLDLALNRIAPLLQPPLAAIQRRWT